MAGARAAAPGSAAVKTGPLLLAAGLALIAPPALGAAAAPKAKAPARTAAQDWAKLVAATPEGGFRIGNPNAPVKLVEYGSLTCPHCAHFAAEAMPELIGSYVKSGRVSFEIRNFVRDPYDLAATLISRCGGAGRYFPLTEQIFATQSEWTDALGRLSAEEYDAINALPPMPKLQRIASVTGLDALAARHGVPAAKAKACLADTKAVERLTAMRGVAVERHQLQGTPTFLINGRKADGVGDWAALKPLLDRPGG
jgi:protein-disulfide isomerase